MKIKIDLHVHSKFSGDTNSEPEESILHAISLNLDGIAFTEHYSYEASGHADRLREKYAGSIMVFRGVEFSSSEGHCLVFGVNTDNIAINNAAMEEVVRVVNEKGGVVIPTHPFRGANSVGDRVMGIGGLCAIEGHNGYSHYSMNLKAVRAAGELGLPYTGGSDAHEPQDVGACYTVFNHEVNHENFIDQLRGGDYEGVDRRKISKVWPF